LDNIVPQPLRGFCDRQEREPDALGGCIGRQERFDGRRKPRRMCTERLMREVNIPVEWVIGFKKLKRSVVAGLKIKFRALVKFLQP
jgi:hypothetical protein